MEEVSCQGWPLKTIAEPWAPKISIFWQSAGRGIQDPDDFFKAGCRPFRTRALYVFYHEFKIKQLAVSFVRFMNGLFVCGLRFVWETGDDEYLGYIQPSQEITIDFPTAQYIKGWHLALDIAGIKAIAIVTADGSMSSWAGEPDNYPRWHLVLDESVAAVKAEFDVSCTNGFIYTIRT
jgi:hypothetical protein